MQQDAGNEIVMQAGYGETVTGTEGHGAAPRRRRSLDLDEDAQVASMAELPRSAAVPSCGCRGHPCCCGALVGTSQLGRLGAHPSAHPSAPSHQDDDE